MMEILPKLSPQLEVYIKQVFFFLLKIPTQPLKTQHLRYLLYYFFLSTYRFLACHIIYLHVIFIIYDVKSMLHEGRNFLKLI